MNRIDATFKLKEIVKTKENGGGEGEAHGGFSGKKEVISPHGIRLDEPKMDQYSLMSSKYHSVMDLGARPKTTLSNQEKRTHYHRRRDKIAQDGSDRMADLFIDTEEKEKRPKEAINMGNTDPLPVHISKTTQIETVTKATTYVAQPAATTTTEVNDKHVGSEDRLEEISHDLYDSNNSTFTQTAQSERTSNMDIASNITKGATGGQIYQEEQAIGTSSNSSGSSTSLQSELPNPYDKDIREKMNKEAMMEKLPEREQDALTLPMKATLAEKATEDIDLVLVYQTFEVLKEDCDKELQERNKTDKSINQVLSVIILFIEELEGLIMNNIIPTDRRKIFFNEKRSGSIDGCTLHKKNECHGEIILIYFEEDIPALMAEFCRNGKKNPIIFIYSHYIPCAGLPIEYNCAEEIAKVSIVYENKCTIVVGYSNTFERTDKKQALNFLSNSVISSVLEFKPNGFEWMFPKQLKKRKPYLFQKQLFSLMCSCDEESYDKEAQENIAFEVNNLVHQYTSQQNNQFSGDISKLGLNWIGQFLYKKKYTPHNQSLKLKMMIRLIDLMEQDRQNRPLQFGMPKTGSLTDSEWHPIKGLLKTKWCDLKLYPNHVDPPNIVIFSIKEKKFDPFRKKKENDQFGIFKQQVAILYDERQNAKAKMKKVKAYSGTTTGMR